VAEEIGQIPPVFTEVAGRVQHAKDEAARLALQAHERGCRVDGHGGVTYDPLTGGTGPQAMREGQAAAEVFAGRIDGAVREASEADEEAAGKLRRLTPEATGFAPPPTAGSTSIPGADIPDGRMPPQKVATWWDGLTSMQKESATITNPDEGHNGRTFGWIGVHRHSMYPEKLGELDGIPTAARDRCNRELLARAKAKLTEREHFASGDQLARIKGALRDIEVIEARLDTEPSAAQPQAYLLGFDTRGTGHAIVAMGNPDTAANVATYVPGTHARLGNIHEGLVRSDRMVQAARQAGSDSTSVIAWYGYNAPQSLWQAHYLSYAEHAEGKLDTFEDGLRVTHGGTPSHDTVVGHSYGTTVVGQAAFGNNTLDADDVVFVASPGLGASVDAAGDLNLTGVSPDQMHEHVHSTVAPGDIVGLANPGGVDPVLGPSPADPHVGGEIFQSSTGTGYPWDIHSEYWNRNNRALVNRGRRRGQTDELSGGVAWADAHGRSDWRRHFWQALCCGGAVLRRR
jgi:hypothetical protein